MDSDTIAHVRESWKKLAAIAPAAALFCEILLAADRSLRHLFKIDLRSQGAILKHMIGATASKLDNLLALVPVLEARTLRHVGYGAHQSHYETVGAARLKTLGQGLAAGFAPRTRPGWTAVYTIVVDAMTTAANTA